MINCLVFKRRLLQEGEEISKPALAFSLPLLRLLTESNYQKKNQKLLLELDSMGLQKGTKMSLYS